MASPLEERLQRALGTAEEAPAPTPQAPASGGNLEQRLQRATETPPQSQSFFQAAEMPTAAARERMQREAMEVGDPILQGLTAGFGDELTARAISIQTGRPYDEVLAEVRQRSAEISERMGPGPTFAAEFTGGLLPAGRVVQGARMIPGVSRVPTMIGFGLGGAGAGAVAGAGTAEGGLESRLQGAGEGAIVGAGLGVTLPVAGRAAAAVLTPLLNRASGATRDAIRIIRDALEDDRITTEQARDQLQELGVEATIADVAGENVRGVARAAQSVPGPARNLGREVLEERQTGQVQRIADSIEENLGAGTEFRMTRSQLQDARRTAARPLYEGAYEIGIPATDELRDILNTPSGRAALRNAYQLAGDERVILPQITDEAGNLLVGEGRAIPTQVLDYVQRGLTDVLRGERNAITGAIETQSGVAVNNLRQDLLRIMDRDNPVFAAARGVYAGDSAAIAALDQGRRLGRGLARQSDEFDPEQIYDDLERMNEGERAFFRQGLARGLIDAAEATSDTANAVRRLVGTEARRGRLRAAFPDDRTFTRFMSDMARERQFFETRAEVLQGSLTQPRGAEVAERLSGTQGELRNPLRGGLVETAGRVIGRFRAPSPQVRSELGRLLFAQGPEALLAADEIATPRFTRQVLSSFARPQPLSPQMRDASLAALVAGQQRAASQ